jgi:hypothetical protein
MTTTKAFLVLIRSSKSKGSIICYANAGDGGGLLHRVDEQNGSRHENDGAACIALAPDKNDMRGMYVRSDRTKPCFCRYSSMPTFLFRLPDHWFLVYPHVVNVFAIS